MAFTCRCFTLVQLHASGQATLGEQAQLGYDELVELWWGSARGTPSLRRPANAQQVTHLLGTQLHLASVSPQQVHCNS